jgi:DNA polymerase III epsilon subunit-like protein
MSRDSFLGTVTVLDTETTNLQAELAEIVEVAGAVYINQQWQVSSMLLGAENGIPPEASAKNNISNRMIAGLPIFSKVKEDVARLLNWNRSEYFVAHNCRYDQDVLALAWARSGDIGRPADALDQERWICTHRLSKHLLNYDFPDMQYNLSYLRYRLDLPVPDTTSAHRAGDDTLACAVLFEFLVDYAIATGLVEDSADLGRQIHAVCWAPIYHTTWPFGKNKGRPLSEIETDYYIWAMQNMDALNEDRNGYDPDLAASVAKELESRLSDG